MELYKHQQTDIDEVKSLIANGEKRITLNAPTSYGKTLWACSLAIDHKEPVVISMSISSLMEQFIDTFRMLDYDNFSVLKSGNAVSYDSSKHVTLVMEQTLAARLDKHRDMRCSLLLFDEAHERADGARFANITRLLNPNHIVGMTGSMYTPYFTELEGIKVGCTSIDNLTKDGFLTRVEYLVPAFTMDVKIGKKVTSELTSDELSPYQAEEFKRKLIEAYQDNEYFDSRKSTSIWFCSSVAECESYAELLRAYGINAISFHGKLAKKTKASILEAFRTNSDYLLEAEERHLFNYDKPVKKIKIDALVSVQTLTTGFDKKDLNVVVKTYPLISKTKDTQVTGRVVRPHETKSVAWVLDAGKNVLRLGTTYDETIPAPRGSEPAIIREHLEPLACNYYELVATDKNKIYKFNRQDYVNKIEEIKSDTRRLSTLSIDELLNRLIVVDDWREVIFAGVVLMDKVHCEPMTDQYGKEGRGYLAEGYDVPTQSITYKPVLNFLNAGSIDWMSELFEILFSIDELNVGWAVKSIKTRIRSLIRTKKSIYGIRFFATYLLEKHLENEYDDMFFVMKNDDSLSIQEVIEEGDRVFSTKEWAEFYMEKPDKDSLMVRQPKVDDEPFGKTFDIDIMTANEFDIDDEMLPF